MQININIEKKHLLLLLLVMSVFFIGYAKATQVSTTTINPGHTADNVGSGVFGSVASETDAYAFMGDLGIGTSNPQGRLHVSGGNAIVDGQLRVNSDAIILKSVDESKEISLSTWAAPLANTIRSNSDLEIESQFGHLTLRTYGSTKQLLLDSGGEISLAGDVVVYDTLTIGDHSTQQQVANPSGTVNENLCGVTGSGINMICPTGYFAVGIRLEDGGTCTHVKPICAKN